MKADYVVVGSGSSGSAITARLVQNNKSVILVEFGGSDSSVFIQMPAALSYPMNMKRYDWGYVAEPEDTLDGGALACPRGKVLGGSSSINGMIYVRGYANDFDHWAEMGANGWRYTDFLPYFKRMENAHFGETELRGNSGPFCT